MSHAVIQRDEMLTAQLDLGGAPIDLAEYATTGLLAVAVGPRGMGKTNAGLLMAEQLAAQGWVSVLIDPESEMESLYGAAVRDAEHLGALLASREQAIVNLEQYRGLFRNAAEGIFRCNRQGLLLETNPSFLRLLGRPESAAELLQAQPIQGLLAAGDWQRLCGQPCQARLASHRARCQRRGGWRIRPARRRVCAACLA